MQCLNFCIPYRQRLCRLCLFKNCGSRELAAIDHDDDNSISSRENTELSSGIAADDDPEYYGVWGSPFYSNTTQKALEGIAGFKSNSFGGTIGVDTKVNEQAIIGISLSAMHTDIKHKDFKSGDRTKIDSFLLSTYSSYQFNNNWFGQGIFSIGTSKVQNKENRRISDTEYGIAEGKYNSMTFTAEAIGGYNHLVNNCSVLTPMAGMNYGRINDGSYTEYGSAAPQLMEITKKASQKLKLIGGIKLAAIPFKANNLDITPEIHFFVNHDLIGKEAQSVVKMLGINLPPEKAKLQRTSYNIGTSLNARHEQIDYGVSTDLTFAQKYLGLQGSINVRINFQFYELLDAFLSSYALFNCTKCA